MGYVGIWLGINASDIVQGIGMVFAFQAGHWQKAFLKHKKKLAIVSSRLRLAGQLPASDT